MLFKSTTCYEFVTSADNVVPLKFFFDSNYLLAIAKPKNGKVSYVYLKTKFWSVLKIIPLHRLVVFLFADNKKSNILAYMQTGALTKLTYILYEMHRSNNLQINVLSLVTENSPNCVSIHEACLKRVSYDVHTQGHFYRMCDTQFLISNIIEKRSSCYQVSQVCEIAYF